jgi:hypothetical protein
MQRDHGVVRSTTRGCLHCLPSGGDIAISINWQLLSGRSIQSSSRHTRVARKVSLTEYAIGQQVPLALARKKSM